MASGCVVGGLINLTVLLWSTSVLVTGRCGLSCHEGILCSTGGARSHHSRSEDGFSLLSM